MKICIYANCQGDGIAHFMRKARPDLNIVVYRNYQLILGEQQPDDLMRDAADCDTFIYQPTDALKHGMLSSEEMVRQVVPQSAFKLSFAYQFNTGFFPIVKYGKWWTGDRVIEAAKRGENVFGRFHDDQWYYDCARRLLENLAEQARREETCDLKFAPFILQNYQKVHLFLVCNHPTSAFFVHMAREVLRRIKPEWDTEISYVHPNEAKLPGYHPLHPAVVRELGLGYQTDERDGADPDWYRRMMLEISEKKGEM